MSRMMLLLACLALLSLTTTSGSENLSECTDCWYPNLCINDKCLQSKRIGDDCSFDAQCQFRDFYSRCAYLSRRVPGGGRNQRTETYRECTCDGGLSRNGTCVPRIYDKRETYTISGAAVIVVIIVVFLCCCRKRKNNQNETLDKQPESIVFCCGMPCSTLCYRLAKSYSFTRGQQVHAVIPGVTSPSAPPLDTWNAQNWGTTGSQVSVHHLGNCTVYVNSTPSPSAPLDELPVYSYTNQYTSSYTSPSISKY